MSGAKSICTVCNYVYDESLHDAGKHSNVAKFETLPDDWKCPECKSAKDVFQPCSCVSYTAIEESCAAHSGTSELAKQSEFRQALVAAYKSGTVGQLVAERPSLAVVLEQLGIDYCCGGKVSLEISCKKKGLNVDEVVEKLLAVEYKQLQQDEPDWNKASLKELTEHIVKTYHQPLREDLPRVQELAKKVARVHGENHPEMLTVLEIFQRFKAELELHMQKEEMILFPAINGMESGSGSQFGCGGGIENPISVMTHEHDAAGEMMTSMRNLTNDYTPPANACNSFRGLLSSLAEIELQMHKHVHKENSILFPRAIALSKPATASCRH